MHWTTPKRSATNWPCRWRGWKPGGDGKVGIRFGYGSIPINTIFSGMNIHLPAILMFTRGTRFWHTAISFQKSYGKGVVNGLEWPKDVCQKHEFDSNELAEESLPVSGIGRSFFFFFWDWDLESCHEGGEVNVKPGFSMFLPHLQSYVLWGWVEG